MGDIKKFIEDLKRFDRTRPMEIYFVKGSEFENNKTGFLMDKKMFIPYGMVDELAAHNVIDLKNNTVLGKDMVVVNFEYFKNEFFKVSEGIVDKLVDKLVDNIMQDAMNILINVKKDLN